MGVEESGMRRAGRGNRTREEGGDSERGEGDRGERREENAGEERSGQTGGVDDGWEREQLRGRERGELGDEWRAKRGEGESAYAMQISSLCHGNVCIIQDDKTIYSVLLRNDSKLGLRNQGTIYNVHCTMYTMYTMYTVQ